MLWVEVKKNSTNESFKVGLSDLTYTPRSSNKTIKYLFVTLEEYFSWLQKGRKGLPEAEKSTVLDSNIINIEHVYPQNPPKRIKNIEPIKHGIGNLSVWGYDDNSSVKNDSFKKKKSLYLASKIKLNNEIGSSLKWDKKAIEKRTVLLIDMALSVFSG